MSDKQALPPHAVEELDRIETIRRKFGYGRDRVEPCDRYAAHEGQSYCVICGHGWGAHEIAWLCNRALKALVLRPAERPPQAWQPIASAPKDGRWLMVITATASEPKPWFIRWDSAENCWENQRGYRIDTDAELRGLMATHWQELPPLPAAPMVASPVLPAPTPWWKQIAVLAMSALSNGDGNNLADKEQKLRDIYALCDAHWNDPHPAPAVLPPAPKSSSLHSTEDTERIDQIIRAAAVSPVEGTTPNYHARMNMMVASARGYGGNAALAYVEGYNAALELLEAEPRAVPDAPRERE